MTWSVNADLCGVQHFPLSNLVTVAVVSDGAVQASALNLFDLVPQDVQAYLKHGGFVYGAYTGPDATNPPGASYGLVLKDAMGSDLTFESQLHTADNPAIAGDSGDTGIYFILNKIINLTSDFDGDADDTILIHFVILR